MKTYQETTTSQLVDRFDNELMNILMSDLQAIKAAKNKLINTVGLNQGGLTAA